MAQTLSTVETSSESNYKSVKNFHTSASSEKTNNIFHDDYIIPIIAETNRTTTSFIITNLICMAGTLTQSLAGMLFNLKNESSFPKFFQKLFTIVYFGFNSKNQSWLEFAIIMVFIINFSNLFFLIYVLSTYKKHREMKKWTLWTMRIWLGDIYPIFIYPNSSSVAASFYLLSKNFSPFNQFLTILSLISFAIGSFHTFILIPLLYNTLFLFKNSGYLWRASQFFEAIYFCSFLVAIEILFQSSSRKTSYISYAYMFFLSFFFTTQYKSFPFEDPSYNGSYLSVGLSYFFCSLIYTITSIFKIQLSKTIQIIIPSCSYLISFIINHIYIVQYGKKIEKELSYEAFYDYLEKKDIQSSNDNVNENLLQKNDQDEILSKSNNEGAGDSTTPDLNEANKMEYFSTLHLQPFNYVEFGLRNQADLFLDWSLTKYLMKTYQNDRELLLFMAWQVSFFRSEASIMQPLIQMIGEMEFDSIVLRAYYYQLHRIFIFWQSGSSTEASHDLATVVHETDQCISQFRQVWLRVAANNDNSEIQFEHGNLTHIRTATEALWTEMLEKYPNNATFASEYVRFLLDVKCDYESAQQWIYNAELLKEGKRLRADKMFKQFIQFYPSYLKKGIVDPTGCLIRKNQKKPINDLHSEAVLHGNSNSVEERDLQLDLDHFKNIIPQADLRLQFQKAIARSSSDNNLFARFGSILKFCFILISIALLIFFFKLMFKPYAREFFFARTFYITNIYFTYFQNSLFWLFYVASYGEISNSEIISIIQKGSSSEDIQNLLSKGFSLDNTTYSLQQMGFRSLNIIDDMIDQLSGKNLYKSISMIQNLFHSEYKYFKCNAQQMIDYNGIPDNFTTNNIFRNYIIQGLIYSTSPSSLQQWMSTTTLCDELHNEQFINKLFEAITISTIPAYAGEIFKIYSGQKSTFFPYTQTTPNQYIDSNEIIEIHNITIDQILDAINKDQVVFNKYSRNTLIWSPFLISVFTILPVIALSYGHYNERKNNTALLTSFTPKQCKAAAELFVKDESYVETHFNEVESYSHIKGGLISEHRNYWISIIISSSIFLIMCIILCVLSQHYANQIFSFSQNIILFGQIFNYFGNLITFSHKKLLLRHMLNNNSNLFVDNGLNPDNIEFFSDEFFNKQILYYSNKFQILFELLTLGSSDYFKISSALSENYPFRSTLYSFPKDILSSNQECPDDFHNYIDTDIFFCLSLYNIILYGHSLAHIIATSPEIVDFKSYESIMQYVLFKTRTYHTFLDLNSTIHDCYFRVKADFNLVIRIFAVVSIFIAFFLFINDIIIEKKLIDEMETYISIILRIDPCAFVSNQMAMSKFFNRFNLGDTKVLSGAHAAFYSDPDPIISLNNEGIIESVNPEVTRLLGYTPEQLIGQPLSLIFPLYQDQNASQILYAMQQMRSANNELVFQTSSNAVSDDGNPVHFAVTLIGITENSLKLQAHQNSTLPFNSDSATYSDSFEKLDGKSGDRQIKSFALICHDLTESDKLKAEIDSIRKQSTLFLQQLLSREYVLRSNRGEIQPIFQVPYSTVITSNIVDFQGYMKFVSHRELIHNIKLLFGAYDQLIASLPHLVKVFVMGDRYVAASGIFADESQQAEATTQAIQFCTQIIDATEEINIALAANLLLKVGAYYGGPITAGIRSSQNAKFEIIGAPILISSIAQNHSEPNKVHITQSVYEIIASKDFEIENGPEEEYPIIGKTKTYYVIPQHKRVLPSDTFTGLIPSSSTFSNLTSNDYQSTFTRVSSN